MIIVIVLIIIDFYKHVNTFYGNFHGFLSLDFFNDYISLSLHINVKNVVSLITELTGEILRRNEGGGQKAMKFKTRLRVTLIIIIVLPLVLIALAFCGIGLYLMNVQAGLPIEQMDYTNMSENMREIVNATEEVYLVLQKQAEA